MSEWVKLRGIALAGLLNLRRKTMPHQTTYECVLAELDEVELEQKVGQFFAQQQDDNITISIDGKVLRGTIAAGETQGTHLLAAYVPETGVVLMQLEVDCKASEIVAAPPLLSYLDLTGCVVTGDALFTQRDLCIDIIEAGDILFCLSKPTRKLYNMRLRMRLCLQLLPKHIKPFLLTKTVLKVSIWDMGALSDAISPSHPT